MLELGLGVFALSCAVLALAAGAGSYYRPAPVRDRRSADDRYRAGDCVRCGWPLEDMELVNGYAACGECST